MSQSDHLLPVASVTRDVILGSSHIIHWTYLSPTRMRLIIHPELNTMTDTNSQRQNMYTKPNTGFGNFNNNVYNQHYNPRVPIGQTYGMQHTPGSDLAALAHSFQGMNMQSTTFAAQAKNAMMSTAAPHYGGLSMSANMPANIYNNGQYMFPAANTYGAANQYQPSGSYSSQGAQYMQQGQYPVYQQQDNSPASQAWTPTTHTTGDVPTLITPRRDSVSSNENDQPGTPSYAGYPAFNQAGVMINRSPSGIFTHSTPSPTSMGYGMSAAKQSEPTNLSPRLQLLVAREPCIPHAIPAPSSPLKPLDRALENQRGETNVYIRGLLPETTDEMLEAWGTRFGDIKSSKSIIDHTTGLCKGYVQAKLFH